MESQGLSQFSWSITCFLIWDLTSFIILNAKHVWGVGWRKWDGTFWEVNIGWLSGDVLQMWFCLFEHWGSHVMSVDFCFLIYKMEILVYHMLCIKMAGTVLPTCCIWSSWGGILWTDIAKNNTRPQLHEVRVEQSEFRIGHCLSLEVVMA